MRSATSTARRSAIIIGATLAMAMATTAHAQSTGVPVCDEFLTKYDTCVTSKLPAEQRATFKSQLDQTRKAWVDMGKNPQTKSALESSCKQTMDAIKASLQAYGCTF
jgi:hypothetical protein